MNAPARRPNGTLLPGQAALNPGGRPRGTIEEFRARFNPRMPEVADVLLELMRSPNESTRLSAVREILDRLLGKPAVFVDATHTKVDIASLYLQALKRANGVPTGQTIDADPEVPAESAPPHDDSPW
jgi:hypothetical protein